MEDIVSKIKQKHPDIKIFVGGAPLSQAFNDKIGADGYFKEPNALVKHLK